jgi:hypothetical protein
MMDRPPRPDKPATLNIGASVALDDSSSHDPGNPAL